MSASVEDNKAARIAFAGEFQVLFGPLGITQAELARRLSVQASTVTEWAQGRVRTPGPARAYMQLLFRILGVIDFVRFDKDGKPKINREGRKKTP